VETDLAGAVDGIAERFVAEEMHGQIIEAEHLARYYWAAPLVSGRRVLDAGCGTAYGSAILAAANAREVIGVDVAADVLKAVKARMPESVELREADVSNLPFDAGTFDVIVCFEVIEHVEDAAAALDELARVLAEDGVLAISSPNRDAYMPGNPHHQYEFVPEEFAETLRKRFANIRLYRQADWITSAVLDDGLHGFEGEKPLREVQLRKSVAAEAGDELYTLALAANGAIPESPASAVLGSATEIKAVAEEGERLERDRRELTRRTALADHEDAEVHRELAELRNRLFALETELARAHQQISRYSADLDAEELNVHELEETQRQVRAEFEKAHQAIHEMQETKAWRLATSFRNLRDRLLRRRRA
jgi:2-polyprenyl-3-methyl-5-hydroxy-6-metoxy-1,4-benzoquinol methylase